MWLKVFAVVHSDAFLEKGNILYISAIPSNACIAFGTVAVCVKPF